MSKPWILEDRYDGGDRTEYRIVCDDVAITSWLSSDVRVLLENLTKARNESVEPYEAVLEDHRRLVRELDVIWNGEAGAAKQASLCDLVAQIKNERGLTR